MLKPWRCKPLLWLYKHLMHGKSYPPCLDVIKNSTKRQSSQQRVCCVFVSSPSLHERYNQIQKVPVESKHCLQLVNICHTASHTLLPFYQHSLFREACQNKHPACANLCMWCSFTGRERKPTEQQLHSKKKCNLSVSFFFLALLLGSKGQESELMNPLHPHTCTVVHAWKTGRLHCELIPNLIKTSLEFYFHSWCIRCWSFAIQLHFPQVRIVTEKYFTLALMMILLMHQIILCQIPQIEHRLRFI